MEILSDIVNKYSKDIILSTQELIRINSVNGNPIEGKPFGKGVDDALQYVISLGKSFDLKTHYYEGYYGYIEMGEGDELIAILAHLDVVPAENPDRWKYPPFGGEIHDNKLYGRGALDDKGPLIAVLYSMRAIQEAGLPLNKRIRLFLGTNEETNWQCIEKYLQVEEVPSYGFVADSDYPLINAEKGLLQLKLSIKGGASFILKGGNAFNSVPDKCIYIKDDTSTEFTGSTAHSAKCWEGENAIVMAAIKLYDEGVNNKLIDFIYNELKDDCYGTNIYGIFEDIESGRLTVNISKVNISEKVQEIFLDIRYPVTKSKKEVIQLLENKCSLYEIVIDEMDTLPSLYIPKDHFLVKILREVFHSETGLDSQPISTGGATYARALKNFVAFGPLFPGHKKMAHQQDEFIDIDILIKNAHIYSKAIATLGMDNKISVNKA
ncbi:Sapep family Mn(2+)-dependent dipeptidase [Alkaliphilus peptidifermentans]|uniref:Dipeptidase, putative n=1 Tax=Alkaliphilus peptidifermentans DSM 18978 TaxID=1120976 RepID=A0A1G5I0D0_9FIRM|nr:Sapep family Mn(2+)-dependent dipeptidase [Alkaliphilus peptidifermentans]SCY69394.1 dipeptidase, putative [Alkaliphilus peptidifermentans DSM 18978]